MPLDSPGRFRLTALDSVRGRIASLILIVAVFLVVLVSATHPGPLGQHAAPSNVLRELSQSAVTPDCNSVLPPQEIASQVSLAYDAGQSATWPNETATTQQVSSMFGTVCAEPSFSSLVSAWGAQNFSLEIYANGDGVQWANFTETWTNWSSSVLFAGEAVWAGNLTTSSVRGPTYFEGPAGPSYVPRQSSGGAPWVSPIEAGIAVVIAASAIAVVATVLVRRRRKSGSR